MFKSGDDGDWGFAPAITFINASSTFRKAGPIAHDKPATVNSCEPDKLDFLNKAWVLLGKPPEWTFPPYDLSQILSNDDKTTALNRKGVRWQDQREDSHSEHKVEKARKDDRLKLSKAQRKKENRRRKRELETKLGAVPSTPPTSSDDESQGESDNWRRSNERRSIIQQLIQPTSTKQGDHPNSEDPLATNSISRSAKSTRSTEQNGQHVSSPYVPPHCRLVPVQTPKPAKLQSLASASTKKSKLVKMLQTNFPEDRTSLSNLNAVLESPRKDQSDVRDSIHVFVDASNIMIGFHDSLKLARGLSIQSRVRRQPLSFHNLSLILERGRPTAKRVLVGSDNFAAIQEAKLIGYETNILDRVHKAKELTPRQKRWRNGNLTGTSGASSGSESTYATHAPEKWVEQGVDEILHLKILESLVDAKTPSTVVLATGDAAEAEYSQGFMKMVERALERGWKVELVSFRHNTSGAYKKSDFRKQWKKSFRIIELDDFVEELLDA